MKPQKCIFFLHDFSVKSKAFLKYACKIASFTESKLFVYCITPNVAEKKAKLALIRRASGYLKKNVDVNIAFDVETGPADERIKHHIQEREPWLAISTNYGYSTTQAWIHLAGTMLIKLQVPLLLLPDKFKRLMLNPVTFYANIEEEMYRKNYYIKVISLVKEFLPLLDHEAQFDIIAFDSYNKHEFSRVLNSVMRNKKYHRIALDDEEKFMSDKLRVFKNDKKNLFVINYSDVKTFSDMYLKVFNSEFIFYNKPILLI